MKQKKQSYLKRVNITPQQVRQPNNYNNIPTDEKAEDWASKNSWFGNDSAMTYTAFDIHKKLVEEEGYDPKSDEYYEEVDKRIRLEFPHKFDKIEGTYRLVNLHKTLPLQRVVQRPVAKL